MKTNAFSGVITALITPFTEQNQLDLESFHKLMIAQKKSGISGVVVLGTTGESTTLTDDESETIVRIALEYQSDHFQILVGTGTNSTATTIEKSLKYANFTKHGKKPDGLLIVTPYYNKPLQEHLIHHYHAVCAAVPETPVCVYNVPGRTGVNIQPKTFLKIVAQNKNVVAIKEAAGNMNAVSEMRLLLNDANLSHVRILSGDDPTFAPSLLCGGDGVISVTTNLIPKIMCQILEYSQKNLLNKVQELHLKTYRLNNGLFFITNPVGIKYLVAKVGLCQNVLRPPLYPTNDNEAKILDDLFMDLQKNKIEFLT